MYINTFKYTPKDVSCQLCTEYVKKLGCTALRCPWLAERIEAGVVGYREAVLETFPHERRLEAFGATSSMSAECSINVPCRATAAAGIPTLIMRPCTC